MASVPKQLVWKGRLHCANCSLDATVGLVQHRGQRVRRQPWAGSTLRLLQTLSIASVPPVFLSSIHFSLYINANDEVSQRHVNGMVNMLIPSEEQPGLAHTAILSRIEADSSIASDPFVIPNNTEQWLDDSPYALVYLERRGGAKAGWQLVLHLLNSPQKLEPLAAGAEAIGHDRCLSSMDAEYAYLEYLAKQNDKSPAPLPNTIVKSAITSTSSSSTTTATTTTTTTTTIAAAGSVVAAYSGVDSNRRKGRISLQDVERMGHGKKYNENACALEPDPEAEQHNKKIAKQLIIMSLKERGIGRDHSDFTALWSQIYRSLKFALRDKLNRQKLSARELKQEVEKHANFYCSV